MRRSWLATAEESATELPGDHAVADPATEVTRAITIDAPPDRVWPWLVQIGADRGGFYSYDRLENLFGLQIHSASRIVDDWQHLQVGDIVYATRKRTAGWYVVELLPYDTLAMKTADLKAGRPVLRTDPVGLEFLWTFAVRPDAAGRTRLLVRERVAFGRRLARVMMAPVGLISFVMTRRMMIGIRDRAERDADRAAARWWAGPRTSPGLRSPARRRSWK